MRQLRAELYLGTQGVAKGVSEAKQQMSSLQSMFRQTGQTLAKMLGGDATRANLTAGLKKSLADVAAAQAKFIAQMRKMDSGDVTKKDITAYGKLGKTLEQTTTAYQKLYQAQQRLVNLGKSTGTSVTNANLAALHQRVQEALAANRGGRMGGDANAKADQRSREAYSRVLNFKLQNAIREDFHQKLAAEAEQRTAIVSALRLQRRSEERKARESRLAESHQATQEGLAEMRKRQAAYASPGAIALAQAHKQVETSDQQRSIVTQQLEQRRAILLALRQQRQTDEKIARDEKLIESHAATQARRQSLAQQAKHWAENPPPVIPSGLFEILRARYKANAGQSGGMQGVLGSMAGYFGGGRMGGLGGAIGGMFGAAGWGAVIGASIGAVMGALRRLLDFFRHGIMEIASYAQHSRNVQAQTGISPKGGLAFERAAEMGGLDRDALPQWISRFQANLSVVEKTGPKVANSLSMLGLPLIKLRSMEPVTALLAVGKAMEKMTNINDKAGIGVALFNRQGAAMGRIFNDLKLIAIGREQVGKQQAFWDKQDSAGNFANRDKLAYLADALGSWTTKLRGFFAGMMDAIGPAIMDFAHWFNKLDLFDVGRKFANDFKPLMNGLVDVILMLKTALLGLLTSLNLVMAGLDLMAEKMVRDWYSARRYLGIDKPPALAVDRNLTPEEAKRLAKIKARRKTGVSDVDDSVAHPAQTGTGSQLAPLSSFFAPFGKGPGDQWSKMGAFSAPGMHNAIATGIKGWHDKVIDLLGRIARNTASKPATADATKPGTYDGGSPGRSSFLNRGRIGVGLKGNGGGESGVGAPSQLDWTGTSISGVTTPSRRGFLTRPGKVTGADTPEMYAAIQKILKGGLPDTGPGAVSKPKGVTADFFAPTRPGKPGKVTGADTLKGIGRPSSVSQTVNTGQRHLQSQTPYLKSMVEHLDYIRRHGLTNDVDLSELNQPSHYTY